MPVVMLSTEHGARSGTEEVGIVRRSWVGHGPEVGVMIKLSITAYLISIVSS